MLAFFLEGDMIVFLDRMIVKKVFAGEEVSCLDSNNRYLFDWSSLLECLDLGSSLFQTFPPFNSQNSLFSLIISATSLSVEKDFFIRLYDQIFIECLTQVRAIPQIQLEYLLKEIREKKDSVLEQSLSIYEKYLIEDPYKAMHDLTLYLAWDRVCVYVSIIFEQPIKDSNGLILIDVFKECLIESFGHIKADGKTNPSFFRLSEALYAYYLREEKLQIHTEREWLILCQSSLGLKPREFLLDLAYIDSTIKASDCIYSEEVKVFTSESRKVVESRLNLVDWVIQKLESEMVHLSYRRSPLEIVYIE